MAQTKNEVAKKEELTPAVRFTNVVTAYFETAVGKPNLTNFQERLVQNYFIATDFALNTAETKRLKMSEEYRHKEAVTWNNVNLDQLKLDVVSAAKIGLDPAQSNHIFPIPYYNYKTKKYDVNLMEGYRGKELKAKKYGLDVPDSIIIEVVYENDIFKPLKKGAKTAVESYEFYIENPFTRGEIVGGFYYYVFTKEPEKNKLVIFDKKAIMKRKPDKAGAEFWGGTKDKWVDGKKSGKEEVEGWYDEMVYKTIARAAYGNITIDSQKIDDDYVRLKKAESTYFEQVIETEIKDNANKELIDVSDFEDVTELEEVPEPEEPPAEEKKDQEDWDNVKNPFDDM